MSSKEEKEMFEELKDQFQEKEEDERLDNEDIKIIGELLWETKVKLNTKHKVSVLKELLIKHLKD